MKTLQRRSSINYKRPQSTISAVAGLPARPALTTGSKHSATLSYVHDPAKFFVQFDDEQQALRQLYDTLASLYRASNEPCSLATGTLVMTAVQAAANKGVEETVHRAVIESLWDNQQMALVRLIDTGGSANVLTNSLKPLPDSMKQIAPFALQCGLHGMKPSGNYTDEEIKKFLEMFFDEEYRSELTVMATVIEKGIQLVHILGDEGQNLTHAYRNAISPQPKPIEGAIVIEILPIQAAMVKERTPTAAIATDYRRHSPQDLEGKTLSVVIVEAASPSDFIIVPTSMQADGDDDIAERLSALNKEMTAFYSNLTPDELRVQCAVPGMPVAALFTADNCWYRAEVTSVRNDQLTLRFVDYGNVAEVSLKEEGVRQLLPEHLERLTAAAIDASLEGVLPADGSRVWSSDAIDFMKELIGKRLTCKFGGRSPDSSNRIYVELLDKSVERDQEASVVAELKRRKLIARGAEETEETVDYERSSTALTAVRASPQPSPQQTLLGFPRQAQKIGVAELAAIVDSSNANNISVQVASAIDQLLMMSQRLSAIYGDPASAPPLMRFPIAKGQKCVAQFAADEQWYRAEVLEDVCVGSVLIPVRFVDYGNCAACHPSQVREVARDDLLLRSPALSFTIRIAGIKPIIDDVWLIAQDIFDSFACDSSMTLLGVDADGVYRAEFTHKNGSKLSTLFISGNLATAQDDDATVDAAGDAIKVAVSRSMGAKETSRPRLPSLELPFGVGDFVDVLVTTSYDAEKMVYVQPVGFASQVSALMKEMGEWPVEVAQRLNDITPGALCAAPYPVDSLPYRAIVKKQTDDDNVEVHFIDFGDAAVVSKSSLRALPDKWARLPAYCFPIQIVNELPPVDDVVVIRIDDILQSHNPTHTTVQAHFFKEQPRPQTAQAEQRNAN